MTPLLALAIFQTAATQIPTVDASETLICGGNWQQPAKVLMLLCIPAQAAIAGPGPAQPSQSGMPALTGMVDISSQAQAWETSIGSSMATTTNTGLTLPVGIPATAIITPNTKFSLVNRPSMTGPASPNWSGQTPIATPALPPLLTFTGATITAGPYCTYINVLWPAGSVPGYGALSAHIPLTATTRQMWYAALRTVLLDAAGKTEPLPAGKLTSNSAN